MSSNQDLNTIFNRIANGEETEGDIQTLRQLLRAREGQNSIQIGKYNVNISEGRDIQIGDRIYQGTDAEAIREVLRSVLQEKRKAERPRTEKLLLQAVKDEVVARLKQSLFIEGIKVTKTQKIGGFNLAGKWKRKNGRIAHKEGWFILTNLGDLKSAMPSATQSGNASYKKRFDIEEMFRDFKSGGYNMEGSNVRGERLISLIY